MLLTILLTDLFNCNEISFDESICLPLKTFSIPFCFIVIRTLNPARQTFSVCVSACLSVCISLFCQSMATWKDNSLTMSMKRKALHAVCSDSKDVRSWIRNLETFGQTDLVQLVISHIARLDDVISQLNFPIAIKFSPTFTFDERVYGKGLVFVVVPPDGAAGAAAKSKTSTTEAAEIDHEKHSACQLAIGGFIGCNVGVEINIDQLIERINTCKSSFPLSDSNAAGSVWSNVVSGRFMRGLELKRQLICYEL